jgi:hypothetical protein
VVEAIRDCGFTRYIATTGLNVNTPADKKDEKVLYATQWMYDHFPATTKEKQEEYELPFRSGIQWTLVRLPRIELTDQRFPPEVSLENCAGETLSFTDLAEFIIA